MENLFLQYHTVLLIFFTKHVQNHWDAEELVQEVFCKILKRRAKPMLPVYPESHLYKIAWSVLRDRHRSDRVRRRGYHVANDESFPEDTLTPERQIDGKQLYLRYLRALNSLTPKTRSVFVLHRYEGLTYSQIAAHCDISISAVEKHMMKALTEIKTLVETYR